MLIDHFSTVIFDLFHTLTSLDAVNAPGPKTADILGVSRKDWNDRLFHYSHDRLTGKSKEPLQIMEHLALSIDPAISRELIARAVEVRTARFRYALQHPDQDTLTALSRLKNEKKTLGLISNADVMEKAGWGSSPLAQYFDHTVFSCDTGVMKPDAAIYRICLDALEVSPAQCIYAGDGSHNELKTAHELGMPTVLVTHVIRDLWRERIEDGRQYARYEIGPLSERFALSCDNDLLRCMPK